MWLEGSGHVSVPRLDNPEVARSGNGAHRGCVTGALGPTPTG
jgi:hypothetical protein